MPDPTVLRCASFGLALTLTGLAAGPAAARAPAAPRTITVEPAPAATVAGRQGAWTAGAAADCTRARRKFWQAGEGWIVRTITTCR